MNNFVIDHPEWQTYRRRTLYASITLIFWVIWGYLWMPLFTFVAWSFGITMAYEHMVDLEGYRGLQRLFGFYLLVIIIMGGSLVTWAFYNYFRFKGVERRNQRPSVSLAMLGERYRLDPAQLAEWQASRRLVIHHDSHSNVMGVEMGDRQWFRNGSLPNAPVAKQELQYIPLPARTAARIEEAS